MTELLFLVEDDVEGGFVARAVGTPIFTQGQTMDELRANIRNAIECHFEDAATKPRVARLHVTRDEIVAI